METRLRHDPQTKRQIKDMLYEYLYGPVQKQFAKTLDALIVKNSQLIVSGHLSFSYKGSFYTCDPCRPPRKLNRLLPQLHAAMDNYLDELQQLNTNELPYVLGFVNQVLNSSEDLHDYLRVFPESTHYPIEQLINTCTCRGNKLSPESVAAIQEKNKASISLMRQRMLSNLLI